VKAKMVVVVDELKVEEFSEVVELPKVKKMEVVKPSETKKLPTFPLKIFY
jgi:hypothetical protein